MSDLLTPVPASPAPAVPAVDSPVTSANVVHSTARQIVSPSIAQRVFRQWIPTAGWALRRTGQRGLVGLALLATTAVFLVSTYRPTVDEVHSLRADLAQAQARTLAAGHRDRVDDTAKDDPRRLLESLPIRADVPKTLGTIIAQAEAAGLSLDTGKYDVTATRTGAVTRTNVTLPVTGPYPVVRGFMDHVLEAVPSAAITELSIERKSIADGVVEANIRLTLYTRGSP